MQTPVVSIYEVGDYDGQIRHAVELLKAGKVVVVPTETVYGAAALLREPAALAKLRSLRPAEPAAAGPADLADPAPVPALPPVATPPPPPVKPFVPHVADARGAMAFLGPVSDLGRRMMRKLWPGPVALVFDVPEARRREVAAGLGVAESDLYEGGTITLRCPDHFVAADLIELAGSPVVAVRAGVSSHQPALRAQQVAEELDGKVDLILDAGPTKYSKPSTIIRVKPPKEGAAGKAGAARGEGASEAVASEAGANEAATAEAGAAAEVEEKGYEIVRAGVYDERIIERLLRTTILFVCTGNTCRSPMAEAITRRVLARKLNVTEADLEKKGVAVMSAGSTAYPGSRATPQAVDAVRNLGADLTHHRSRPLTVELIHQADLIFTMGRSHLQAVQALVPAAADRVSTLAPGRDIEDPIGGDAALYVDLAGQLQTLIEDRLNGAALP